jgi:hypothetical protein
MQQKVEQKKKYRNNVSFEFYQQEQGRAGIAEGLAVVSMYSIFLIIFDRTRFHFFLKYLDHKMPKIGSYFVHFY